MKLRFWRRCLFVVILLSVAVCAAYWHVRRLIEEQIESAVAFRLPSVIGASGTYKVDAAASLIGAAKGTIESVKVEGKDVKLEKGFKLQRLQVTLEGVHLDKTKHKVTKIDRAEFSAFVSPEELNSFIARHYPNIPSRIELCEGFLKITAEPLVEGKRVPVEADALLEIRDGTKVVLRVSRVVSHNIAAPDSALRSIEDRFNPILDLSSLGFKGRINSIAIHPEAIRVSGEGEPGTLPKL